MVKLDEKSNAQSWELEVTCKNRKYLEEVVKAILKYGVINFEVNNVEFIPNSDSWDGRYTILMWSSWFHHLNSITTDLLKIEQRLQ